MREDYHIYYENEEELSVWQPEIKNVMANRKKRRQKICLVQRY